MAIQAKKFNWVRRPTAWEHAKAWRDTRRAMVERFQADTSAVAGSLTRAMNNFTEGTAALAAQASIKQAQAAIAAKRNQINKLV